MNHEKNKKPTKNHYLVTLEICTQGYLKTKDFIVLADCSELAIKKAIEAETSCPHIGLVDGWMVEFNKAFAYRAKSAQAVDHSDAEILKKHLGLI